MTTISEIINKNGGTVSSGFQHLATVFSCSYICTNTCMALTKVLPCWYIVDPYKLPVELAVGAREGLNRLRGLIQ